jgi:23S rRNA G2445 N2-methylase RlmL
MSGSGTFLIEAHDYYKINLERSFSYQHTPLWLDFQTDGKAKREFFEKFKTKKSTTFNHYLAFEINKDIIELAKKNADGKDIIIKEADIFDRKAMSPGMQNLVIINPPYGLRVGSELNISAEYYQKIVGAVKSKYNPERLGIIIPEEYRYDPRKNDCITLSTRHFKNGGLSVVFYVLGFK